jgi:hypothetical protein
LLDFLDNITTNTAKILRSDGFLTDIREMKSGFVLVNWVWLGLENFEILTNLICRIEISLGNTIKITTNFNEIKLFQINVIS